jgi:DNA-binding CsgD family transcriptional regulator
VAVVATDPKRRRELADLVVEAGHDVAREAGASDSREAEAPDVVLADGAIPAMHEPIVTLGADEREQAAALPRDASFAEIDAALRAAAAGLTVRRAETSKGFGAADDHAPSSLLTPREVAILSAIAVGLGNKAIARELDISLHTVKFHVESLLRKLNARTRAEAVAKGLARRIAETIEV